MRKVIAAILVMMLAIPSVSCAVTWEELAKTRSDAEARYIREFNDHYKQYGTFLEIDANRLYYHLRLYWLYEGMRMVEKYNEMGEKYGGLSEDMMNTVKQVQHGMTFIGEAIDEVMMKYLDGKISTDDFRESLMQYLDATMAAIDSGSEK